MTNSEAKSLLLWIARPENVKKRVWYSHYELVLMKEIKTLIKQGNPLSWEHGNVLNRIYRRVAK